MTDKRPGSVIVLTGGGSGGHITPLVAVATKIAEMEPSSTLIYIGQRGDKFGEITRRQFSFNSSHTIWAGKFRRFHGEGWKQFADIGTFLLNVRDFFLVFFGIIQSLILLRKLRPGMIFIKGGYVGVPVGLAAAMLHIPYITHDSDAIPGLANRIISRWAVCHAVALPEEVYDYPKDETVSTGIPIQAEFEPVSKTTKAGFKKTIAVPDKYKLLFVVGGGLGAVRINQAFAEILPHLLKEFPDLYVVQSVGLGNEALQNKFYEVHLDAEEQGRVRVFGFIDDIYHYSGAADLIISRAGATNLAEFAAQGKACIVIPNPILAGGHQLKNAEVLAEKNAAVLLKETDLVDDPNRLTKLVSSLLRDDKRLELLGKNFLSLARPNASEDIAKLILDNTH